jgi:hypothetical protein
VPVSTTSPRLTFGAAAVVAGTASAGTGSIRRLTVEKCKGLDVRFDRSVRATMTSFFPAVGPILGGVSKRWSSRHGFAPIDLYPTTIPGPVWLQMMPNICFSLS